MEELLEKNPGMKVDETRRQAEGNNSFLKKCVQVFAGSVVVGLGLGAIGLMATTKHNGCIVQ